MNDFEFHQLADEQINLLLIALRKAIYSNIRNNQNNTHPYNIELSFIDLIEHHLMNKKIHDFDSVKEYFYWIDNQIQIVNRKIKADETNYYLGQQSLSYFAYLYQELNKMYFGEELTYKVGMANIQLMLSNISEGEL